MYIVITISISTYYRHGLKKFCFFFFTDRGMRAKKVGRAEL